MQKYVHEQYRTNLTQLQFTLEQLVCVILPKEKEFVLISLQFT